MEKLHRTHAVEEFTCGQPELDRFLIHHALQAQQVNSSQTYVGLSGDKIIGYCTIVAGEVRHADAPERITKGMPRHPIPLLVLARLAVHSEWQGRGIGAGLLLDALERTLQVADIAGYARLPFMQKTLRQRHSTSISGLCRPLRTTVTFSCSSKTSALLPALKASLGASSMAIPCS